MFCHACELDNVHILSVFKHGYTVVLFVCLFVSLIFHGHRVALSALMFCEIVYIQQESTKTQCLSP